MSVTAPANQSDLLENQSTSPELPCQPSRVTPKKPTYQSGSQPARWSFKVDKQLKVEFIRGLTHGECCCLEAGVRWKDHKRRARPVLVCWCAYFSWGSCTAVHMWRAEVRKRGVRSKVTVVAFMPFCLGGAAVYFGPVHAMTM